jgi:hypothetical protein
MAVIFAVFLIAALVAFARPEGRARRIERLRAVATRTVGIGEAVLATSTEVLELIAARLAQDHRSHAGLDQILAAAGCRRVDAAGRRRVDSAEPSADL